jgi:hypothetical protein
MGSQNRDRWEQNRTGAATLLRSGVAEGRFPNLTIRRQAEFERTATASAALERLSPLSGSVVRRHVGAEPCVVAVTASLSRDAVVGLEG